MQTALDDISYTCGMVFEELELLGRLKNVCIKDHKCYDPIEKLYYSCEFDLIWVHCRMPPTYLSVKVAKIKESFQSSVRNHDSNEL